MGGDSLDEGLWVRRDSKGSNDTGILVDGEEGFWDFWVDKTDFEEDYYPYSAYMYEDEDLSCLSNLIKW